MKDCNRPIDTARAAAGKIEYYSKKGNKQYLVHSVLAELCAQVDSTSLMNIESNDTNPSDCEIFETILDRQFQVHEAVTNYEEADEDKLHNLVPNTEREDDIPKIYAINTSYLLTNSSKDRFEGACVDSGAQRTVIGKRQALAYLTEYGSTETISNFPDNVPRSSFGSHKHLAEGYINIRIPVGNDSFINIQAAVINLNIPFLLWLENMIRFKIILDVDERTMYSKLEGWSLDLCLKKGHLYHDWEIGILFTENELRKVHNHFYHSEPDRLYSLFRRADPSSISSQLLQDLDSINSTCDTCQREASSPHRFRVSLSHGDVIFNRENCLDLMKINGKQILHVVDRDTRLSAAAILQGESTKDVWRCYL